MGSPIQGNSTVKPWHYHGVAMGYHGIAVTTHVVAIAGHAIATIMPAMACYGIPTTIHG